MPRSLSSSSPEKQRHSALTFGHKITKNERGQERSHCYVGPIDLCLFCSPVVVVEVDQGSGGVPDSNCGAAAQVLPLPDWLASRPRNTQDTRKHRYRTQVATTTKPRYAYTQHEHTRTHKHKTQLIHGTLWPAHKTLVDLTYQQT